MEVSSIMDPPDGRSSQALPTSSPSEVFQKLRASTLPPLSTGLTQLNELLSGTGAITPNAGGIVRGKVTEIYGPPGVGKTAFGLQIASNVLQSGRNVSWIDCGTPLVQDRLVRLLTRAKVDPDADTDGDLDEDAATTTVPTVIKQRFKHLTAVTLSHVLALFLHPQGDFPPSDTDFIVLDSLSTVIDAAYHSNHLNATDRSDAVKWASGRRFAILGQLINALSRVASVHNLAVLVTSHTVTRVRPNQGAMLLPALTGSEWNAGLSTQLILFRDWPPRDKSRKPEEKELWARLRYIGLIKINGRLCVEEGQFETVVPIAIGHSGLQELRMPPERLEVPISSSPGRRAKRPFDQYKGSDDDDSHGSDDEYGWDDEDEIVAEGLLTEKVDD